MHVREQILDAIVARLLVGIPALSDAHGVRCWKHGADKWDQRTHPICVVSGESTKQTDEPGTDGAIQRRQTKVVVEIYDAGFEGDGYVQRISDMSVAAERLLVGLDADVAIERIECTGDTGVGDIAKHGAATRAGTGIGFDVVYYTRRGTADGFVTPFN